MSTVIATSVLPDSTANDTLTIGATGDSVAISGDSLNLNTLQDAGGNNIFVSNGSGTITSTGLPGAMKLILSQTASGAANVAFTTQLTTTYDVYIFKFINIGPATDNATLEFQCSTDGGSNYNTILTSTYYQLYHNEAGNSNGFGYDTGKDQGNGTAYQKISGVGIGNLADECGVGEMHFFGPASTTYMKNWYCTTQIYKQDNESFYCLTAGYFNTTSAINAINFKMDTGNFDGTISMYGISKS